MTMLQTKMMKSSKHTITLKEGTLVYEDYGNGDEVMICLPSLGDIRQEYRFLLPLLIEQGYRVIIADLRGHGESSATFTAYGASELATDIQAIYQEAQIHKASLMGCSISGGVIALFAAQNPEKVEQLIMLSPFTRDVPADRWFRPLSHLLLAKPWGAKVWGSFYKSLFKKHQPKDMSAYLNQLTKALEQKGQLKALGKMIRSSKSQIEEALPKVTTPTLVIMGAVDPDFPNPTEEAHLIQNLMKNTQVTTLVLSELGHYPHVESPQEISQHLSQMRSEPCHSVEKAPG